MYLSKYIGSLDLLVKLWKAQGVEMKSARSTQNMRYQKSKHIRTYWSTVIVSCQGKLISWHIPALVRIQRCPKWFDCLRAEGCFLEDRAGNSKSHVRFQFTGEAQMKYDEVLLCFRREISKRGGVGIGVGALLNRGWCDSCAILCFELPYMFGCWGMPSTSLTTMLGC